MQYRWGNYIQWFAQKQTPCVRCLRVGGLIRKTEGDVEKLGGIPEGLRVKERGSKEEIGEIQGKEGASVALAVAKCCGWSGLLQLEPRGVPGGRP